MANNTFSHAQLTLNGNFENLQNFNCLRNVFNKFFDSDRASVLQKLL